MAVWIIRVFAAGVLIYCWWNEDSWDPCADGSCSAECQ